MEYKAIYDFFTDEKDKLAFKKGDILKVIRRKDEHWLLAHLGEEQGLVPENYLTAIPHEWYVGKITKTEAEDYLMAMPEDGAFMVRDSESTLGDFSLSVKFQNQVQHFKILRDTAGKYFLWVIKFLSINELVAYHKRSSVDRTRDIFLKEPCVPLEDKKCKALYHFETEDKQELSFRQNDIIILTGRPHADWWEGEIRTPTGTRRGLFPKNYVKELDGH